MKKCLMLAALVVILSPAAARADWLFTPHIGTTFGGDGAGGFTYGASLGWMGAGIIGFETEFAFVPDVFNLEDDLDLDLDADELDLVNGGAMSVMFNALVGVPIGGTSGGGFRPYLSGGLGLLSGAIESDELLFDESESKFGFNLGGGAMGYFGKVGLRGDVRYYQTLSDSDPGTEFENALDRAIGDFDFWRGSVGVVFRW